MIARVKYLGQLRTEATHLKSGTVINTDAPTDNRGKGEAFSPTDLAAASLASCILTIMGIVALDNNIDIEGAEASVVKVMSSNPRRISKIEVQINMPKRDYTERQKKRLEKAAHNCPVGLSLNDKTEEYVSIFW